MSYTSSGRRCPNERPVRRGWRGLVLASALLVACEDADGLGDDAVDGGGMQEEVPHPPDARSDEPDEPAPDADIAVSGDGGAGAADAASGDAAVALDATTSADAAGASADALPEPTEDAASDGPEASVDAASTDAASDGPEASVDAASTPVDADAASTPVDADAAPDDPLDAGGDPAPADAAAEDAASSDPLDASSDAAALDAAQAPDGASDAPDAAELADAGTSICATNPCLNAGTCRPSGSTFACTCAPGYGGATCQTDINECAPAPCKNGGQCTDGVNKYTCACAAGYTGTTCQTNINECAPAPCKNGGQCTDGVNSYSCACATGYTGTSCETNIDDCAVSPCLNGGSCADGVNSYVCTCAEGWKGTTCQTPKEPCDDHPCQNNGVCIADGSSSFQCACPNGFTGTLCETVTSATSCSNLWSSVTSFYGSAPSFSSCDNSEAARSIVASLMNLSDVSVTINSKNYLPCIDFRCDASYVYVVSTNLPFYDPPSWLPGGKTNPPSTNLVYRIPLQQTSILSPAPSTVGDSSTLGASCDDAYQYAVGLTSSEVAQEPYGFCSMNARSSKYFWDGSRYYRRANCLTGNGFTIDGQTIYGSNESANGSWGNPAFYYPDNGTSSETYYQVSGKNRPALDLCGTHFHHHGVNARCYERDDDRMPLHTEYTNADVKGLFNFSKWIYENNCTDESEVVGYMVDGVPLKGPCACMARDSAGACTKALPVRSSYVYSGLNAWKGSSASTSTAATDLASYEGQTCTQDSQCGSSGQLECTWSVFADSGAAQTVVEKRCVALNYAWCTHSYVDRASVSADAAGVVYLDRCNGVTSADGYAYHVTGSFPYVPSCFKYEPSDSLTDSTL